MTDGVGITQLGNLLGWLLSMAVNLWLLLVVTPRLGPATAIKRAMLAIAAMWVVVPALIVGLWALGFDPPDRFDTRFLQLVFSWGVLAMLCFANSIFHTMVDRLIEFHQTHNAANLQRFPVNVLIRHQRLFKRGATLVWCVGSGLMFYGIWTDTQL